MGGWFKKPSIGEAAEGIGELTDKLYGYFKGKLTPQEQAEFDLTLAKLQQELMVKQAEINKAEAQNPSVFVSGWRPAIGWLCALAIGYNFIVYPMLTWLCFAFRPEMVDKIPPPFTKGLFELVLAMLGVAGYRTFEKLKGIDTKKVG